MVEKIQRITTEQRANLVAYLDGELDDTQSREIEHMLATSPVVRNEVEVLTRTWELLDTLPRPEAGEDFTHRTMSTIRLDEYREPISEQPWFQKTLRAMYVTGSVIAVIAVGATAFLATNQWVPHETEPLIQEQPLIENLDQYREVGDLEFLRDLESTGLFHPQSEALRPPPAADEDSQSRMGTPEQPSSP